MLMFREALKAGTEERPIYSAKIKLIKNPCHHEIFFSSATSTTTLFSASNLHHLCQFPSGTMANKAPYKTTFEPEHTIQPIYTGGSVALDQSGRILATTLGEDALLTDLNTGKQLAKIEGVCVDSYISPQY
jgi:hypothetical protein